MDQSVTLPKQPDAGNSSDIGRWGRLAASAAGRRVVSAIQAIRRALVQMLAFWPLFAGVAIVLAVMIPAGGLDARAAVASWLAVAGLIAWQALGPAGRVTQHAEAAESHRPLSAESFAPMIEALPHPALLLGPKGHVLLLNGRARDLIGRARRGQHISAQIRAPEFLEAVERICSQGPSEPISVLYEERVPVDRHVGATLAWFAESTGGRATEPAILVSLNDLTERERLDQLRADFVANASHELRTPLASLIGFIETMQGPAATDPPARERFLQIMATQAQRMKRLIDDLMSLTRVEMHAHVQPRQIVELSDTVHGVVEALEPLAREAGVTLRVVPPSGPAAVRGDREELVQVFQNLIHNAIKYGRDGGSVVVSIAREGGDEATGTRRIAIAVKDDGPGIAPRHLPRLTERFYRVDTAESRSKGGTGLGLAIVKHVLARHRGELKITSKLGEGSTFTVLLPAAPPGGRQERDRLRIA